MIDDGAVNFVFIIKSGITIVHHIYLNFFLLRNHTCYNFRSNDSLMIPYIRTKQFKSIFFPSCIFNLNQLNLDMKNYSSLEIFKRALLKFIRPKAANVYKIHHPRGLKLLTGLRLGLSHLREHKFRHNFNDTIDPVRLCGTIPPWWNKQR